MHLLDTMGREVRQSFRALAHEKGFSLTVLAIVAFCLAANVAIFAVVHGVLLQPLPFRDPDQLVLIANAYPKAGVERAGTSAPHYLERREGMEALTEAAAMRGECDDRRGGRAGAGGCDERDAVVLCGSRRAGGDGADVHRGGGFLWKT